MPGGSSMLVKVQTCAFGNRVLGPCTQQAALHRSHPGGSAREDSVLLEGRVVGLDLGEGFSIP